MARALTPGDREASTRDVVTCNDEQQLFVIPAGGGGYSCYGYENCQKESAALAKALGRDDLLPGDDMFGTLAGYERHGELVGLARGRDLGTWFNADTPQPVRDVIERLIGSRTRVRMTYGDRETGQAWDDRPMTGTIGRSGGTLKVPLLIKTARSSGGEALLDACIVRIEAEGRDLYRHARFHLKPAEPAGDAEPEALPAPGM